MPTATLPVAEPAREKIYATLRERPLVEIVIAAGKPYGLVEADAEEGQLAFDFAATFFLTMDTENPKPDRRSKDWHKLPTWARGERFQLVIRRWKPDPQPQEDNWRKLVERDGGYELLGCYRCSARWSSVEWSDMTPEQRETLLAGLAWVDETLEESFARVAGIHNDQTAVSAFLLWAVENGELGREHALRLMYRSAHEEG